MAGRPKRVFSDEEIQLIEQYALDGCYSETIAAGLEIPVTTLKRHFGRKMTHLRAKGKLILKHNQTQMAKSSPQMAIFLGKNELGQADKQIVSTETVAPVVSEDERKAYEEAGKAFKLRMA